MMKLANVPSKTLTSSEKAISPSQLQLQKLPPKPDNQQVTRGQWLADKLASKVGSWSFLIGQSTVLAAWVGINLTPGLPHWDESPFILLNLVFSFASAYTAPIVLMSQNRQSDVDREKSDYNHKVNLKTAHALELLHQKIDELHELRTSKLEELVELIKQQQQSRDEIKVNAQPAPAPVAVSHTQSEHFPKTIVLLPTVFNGLPALNEKNQREFGNEFLNLDFSNSTQSVQNNANLLSRSYIDQNNSKAQ